MNAAIAPIAPALNLQASSPAAPGQAPDLQIAQLPQNPQAAPSALDGAEFARVAAQGAPLQIRAELPPSADRIGSSLMHHMEQLTQRLGGLQSGIGPNAVQQASEKPSGLSSSPIPSGSDAPQPPAAEADRASMDGAIAQIEHAYMFAIETTMVSRGSTESTKIFNTLLKGQ